MLQNFINIFKAPFKSYSNNDALLHNKSEDIYRLLFTILSCLLIIFMPVLSFQYGVVGDEWIQNDYGKEVFNYFFHGDTNAYREIGRPQGYDAIIYYSGGYELLLVSIAKLFPSYLEYEVRHIIVAITGALLFIVTGLVGRKLGGWQVGFFAILLMALSPRMFGESMNNSKDIPFAFSIMFALYHFIPFLKSIPKPNWKSVIYISIAIGLAFSIRIGAFLLLGYLGLFSAFYYIRYCVQNKNYKFINPDLGKLFLKAAVIFIASYIIGIITWPYALQDPINNPFSSFEQMAKFPVIIRILFEGQMINSELVPWNYAPVWIGITSPEIVILAFILFLPLIYLISKHFKEPFVYGILFTAIFPIVFAITNHSNLYDTWRHFFFVYPSIVIGAALVIGFVISKAKSKSLKIAIAACIGIGLILPVKSMVALHPYESSYFNDIYGGLPKAFTNFETDYYFTSAKEAVETLAEKENFSNLKDTVVIASNMVKEVNIYAQKISPFLKVIYSKFENRANYNYDFAIFNSRFVSLDLLKSGVWASPFCYFKVERQGIPLAAIYKNSSKEAYEGTLAFNEKNYENAIQHYKNYLLVDSFHEAVWSNLATSYLYSQKTDLALPTFKRALALDPSDYNTINYAIGHLMINENAKAIQILTAGATEIKKDLDFYTLKNQEKPGNMVIANYLNNYLSTLSQYYYYLAAAYRQTGDKQQEQYFISLYQQISKLN